MCKYNIAVEKSQFMKFILHIFMLLAMAFQWNKKFSLFLLVIQKYTCMILIIPPVKQKSCTKYEIILQRMRNHWLHIVFFSSPSLSLWCSWDEICQTGHITYNVGSKNQWGGKKRRENENMLQKHVCMLGSQGQGTMPVKSSAPFTCNTASHLWCELKARRRGCCMATYLCLAASPSFLKTKQGHLQVFVGFGPTQLRWTLFTYNLFTGNDDCYFSFSSWRKKN